jgi:hypothetical protein
MRSGSKWIEWVMMRMLAQSQRLKEKTGMQTRRKTSDG